MNILVLGGQTLIMSNASLSGSIQHEPLTSIVCCRPGCSNVAVAGEASPVQVWPRRTCSVTHLKCSDMID